MLSNYLLDPPLIGSRVVFQEVVRHRLNQFRQTCLVEEGVDTQEDLLDCNCWRPARIFPDDAQAHIITVKQKSNNQEKKKLRKRDQIIVK